MSLKKIVKSGLIATAGLVFAIGSYTTVSAQLKEFSTSNNTLDNYVESHLETNNQNFNQDTFKTNENINMENANYNMASLQQYMNLEEFISELDLNTHIEHKNYLEQLPSTQPNGYIHHSVNQGETLSQIVSQHMQNNTRQEVYQTINNVMEKNSLSSPNIRFGETLILPITSNKISDNLEYSNLTFNQRIQFFLDRTIANAEPYIEDIIRISEENEIDARIPMAIASIESNFVPTARSGYGAVGLFQQLPRYHNVSQDDNENLVTKINFFRNMYNRFLEFHQDEQKALISSIAGYNVGPNRVMEYLEQGTWDGITINEFPRNGNNQIGFSFETRNYLGRVIEKLREYNVKLPFSE